MSGGAAPGAGEKAEARSGITRPLPGSRSERSDGPSATEAALVALLALVAPLGLCVRSCPWCIRYGLGMAHHVSRVYGPVSLVLQASLSSLDLPDLPKRSCHRQLHPKAFAAQSQGGFDAVSDSSMRDVIPLAGQCSISYAVFRSNCCRPADCLVYDQQRELGATEMTNDFTRDYGCSC